jgi:hypothetical protein
MKRRLRPALDLVAPSLCLAVCLAALLAAFTAGGGFSPAPARVQPTLLANAELSPDADAPCEAEGDRDDSAGRDAAVLLHVAPHVDSLPRLETGPVIELARPCPPRAWTPVIDRGPPSTI